MDTAVELGAGDVTEITYDDLPRPDASSVTGYRWLPADSGSHLVSQMPLDPLEVFGSPFNSEVDMSVTTSQAVVYKGGGRRYLTLRSACAAEARALLKTRCECEAMDHGPMGYEHLTCWYHEDERNAVLMRRLTGGYMRRFRAQR